MKKFKMLTILLLLSSVLVLTACMNIDLQQSVHSDGSVIVKQEVDFLDYVNALLEQGGESEIIDEDSDLSQEEQILLTATGMAEGMCAGMIEESEQNYNWREIFSACEILENGKLILYSILGPGSYNVKKQGEVYEYYLKDLLVDHEIDEGEEADFLLNMSFKLFFEGEIISSDIGEVNNNQLSFNLAQLRQINQENANAVIRARVNLSNQDSVKQKVNYLIESFDDIYILPDGYTLSASNFSRIERIWGLNQEQLKSKLCSNDSNLRYSNKVQNINCQSNQEIVINKNGQGVVDFNLFLESDDYYQYSLMNIIALSKIDSVDWFKDQIITQFSSNSEFHFYFFNDIKEVNAGEINNKNKLILTWEEVKNINEDSVVKIYKTNPINNQQSQENNQNFSNLEQEEINQNQDNNNENQSQHAIKNQFTPKYSVKNESMYGNLKGKIILQVESKGEAYYIHPGKKEMHYLGRPEDAFNVMREQGTGISNSNLNKIPISLDNLSGLDSDGDGLPDDFEIAIGTNPNNPDTDGDGYDDFTEILHGYNPLGSGKINYDNSFARVQAGRIFLQVEQNGEAWYINPQNNKRYFLGRPNDAFNIMRDLGLGISNNDLNKLK